MKPRILIVDDDPTITQQLSWTLSEEYQVLTANDMQSAVRRATLFTPAVAILDLQLPPHPHSFEVGLRVLEYLKAHVPKSKVLIITGARADKTEKACAAIGADGFLYKPFDTELLLSMIRRLAPRQLEFA